MSENTPRWFVILRTHNSVEAQIVAGRLQSEGITALVSQEPAGSALGITIGLLGEVRVLVPEAEQERARAILEVDETDMLSDDNDRIIYGGDDFDE